MDEVETLVTADGWVRVEQPGGGYSYIKPSMVMSVVYNGDNTVVMHLFNGAMYKIAELPLDIVERLEQGARRERKAARP